jgi:hypothetical protein
VATVRQWLDPGEAQYLTSSTYPQLLKRNGTNLPVTGLAFDTATSELCHWRRPALSYGSGNITATVYWYGDTATSGGVVWEIAIAAITPDTDTTDIETKAYATAQNAADTHLGTTAHRIMQCPVTVTNLDTVAANDWVSIRLARLTGNASDTMLGDAVMVGVAFTYSDV